MGEKGECYNICQTETETEIGTGAATATINTAGTVLLCMYHLYCLLH